MYAATTAENFAVCSSLLQEAIQGFQASGTDGLIAEAISQYESKPAGPYIYCYSGASENEADVVDLVRFVHPYLQLNETIAESVKNMTQVNAEAYEAGYIDASTKAIDECCANFFNYSVAFNQAASDNSSSVEVGSQREYLGFSEKIGVGSGEEIFYCGCPYTNIPDGDRGNRNIPLLKETLGSGSSPAVGVGFGVIVALLSVFVPF